MTLDTHSSGTDASTQPTQYDSTIYQSHYLLHSVLAMSASTAALMLLFWGQIHDINFSPELLISAKFNVPAYYAGITTGSSAYSMGYAASLASVGGCIETDYRSVKLERGLSNLFQELPSCSSIQLPNVVANMSWFESFQFMTVNDNNCSLGSDGTVAGNCMRAHHEDYLGTGFSYTGTDKMAVSHNASGYPDEYLPTYTMKYNSSFGDLSQCRKQFAAADSCDWANNITEGCAVTRNIRYTCGGGCTTVGSLTSCCNVHGSDLASCTEAGVCLTTSHTAVCENATADTTASACATNVNCVWKPMNCTYASLRTDLDFDMSITTFGLQHPTISDPGSDVGRCMNRIPTASCESTHALDQLGCEANTTYCNWVAQAGFDTHRHCNKLSVQASLQSLSIASAQLYNIEERVGVTLSSSYVPCSRDDCIQTASGFCQEVTQLPDVDCKDASRNTHASCEAGTNDCVWRNRPAGNTYTFGSDRSCDWVPAEIQSESKGYVALRLTVLIDTADSDDGRVTLVPPTRPDFYSVTSAQIVRNIQYAYGDMILDRSSFRYQKVMLDGIMYTRSSFTLTTGCFSSYDVTGTLTDNTFALAVADLDSSHVFDFSFVLFSSLQLPVMDAAGVITHVEGDISSSINVSNTQDIKNTKTTTVDMVHISTVPDTMATVTRGIGITAEIYNSKCVSNCLPQTFHQKLGSITIGVRIIDNQAAAISASDFELSLYHMLSTPVQPLISGGVQCGNKYARANVLGTSSDTLTALDSAIMNALIPFNSGTIVSSDSGKLHYSRCRMGGAFIGTCVAKSGNTASSGVCGLHSIVEASTSAIGLHSIVEASTSGVGQVACESELNGGSTPVCDWTAATPQKWRCFDAEADPAPIILAVGESLEPAWRAYCADDVRARKHFNKIEDICPRAQPVSGCLRPYSNGVPISVTYNPTSYGNADDGLCYTTCLSDGSSAAPFFVVPMLESWDTADITKQNVGDVSIATWHSSYGAGGVEAAVVAAANDVVWDDTALAATDSSVCTTTPTRSCKCFPYTETVSAIQLKCLFKPVSSGFTISGFVDLEIAPSAAAIAIDFVLPGEDARVMPIAFPHADVAISYGDLLPSAANSGWSQCSGQENTHTHTDGVHISSTVDECVFNTRKCSAFAALPNVYDGSSPTTAIQRSLSTTLPGSHVIDIAALLSPCASAAGARRLLTVSHTGMGQGHGTAIVPFIVLPLESGVHTPAENTTETVSDSGIIAIALAVPLGCGIIVITFFMYVWAHRHAYMDMMRQQRPGGSRVHIRGGYTPVPR